MKKEIIFTAPPLGSIESYLELLSEFDRQHDVRIHLHSMAWEKYRSDLVGIAMKQQGADVSAVGNPVTSDLIGMNALRPFTTEEIAALGGSGAFLPARWESGMRPNSPQVWAVPWLLDIRLLYYWRDKLFAAGVNETMAFADLHGFVEAVRQLKESGVPVPFAPPQARFNVMHVVCSFIWAAGGDLFSPDGKKVVFQQERALRGIAAYFNLLQYLPADYVVESPDDVFSSRQAAMAVCGGGALLNVHLADRLGVVPPPGGSYVGGADLVIWKHTHEAEICFELVKFLLASAPRLAKTAGMLPPQMRELNRPEALHPKFGSVLSQVGLMGRTYPCVPTIGLVEDRLSTLLMQIQQEVLSKRLGVAEVDNLVRTRVVALANRINLSLSS